MQGLAPEKLARRCRVNPANKNPSVRRKPYKVRLFALDFREYQATSSRQPLDDE